MMSSRWVWGAVALPLEPSKNVCLILADGDWPDTVRYNEKLYARLKVEKSLLLVRDSNHYDGMEYGTGNRVIDPPPPAPARR